VGPQSEGKAAYKCSACGYSFKTVGKAFQVKLVERMPRVCKAVIKTKVGYFEEPKIYFDLFNTFLVTT
jgi:transposase-like protein